MDYLRFLCFGILVPSLYMRRTHLDILDNLYSDPLIILRQMNKGVILVGLFSSYVAHIGCSYIARLLTFLLKTEKEKKKNPKS